MEKPSEAEVIGTGQWLAQCAAQALLKLQVKDAELGVRLREAISDWERTAMKWARK